MGGGFLFYFFFSSTILSFCGLCAESFYHLFWECSKARDTWAHSPFLSSLSVVPFRSFFDFLWNIILEADWSMEDIGLAITIAWALWSNRNEVIHGKPRKAGLKLVDWCKNYLDEYWSANRTSVNPPAHLEVAWSPSNFPSYKVNVDAARFMAQKAVGAGVIIRDHEGKFIAGFKQ